MLDILQGSPKNLSQDKMSIMMRYTIAVLIGLGGMASQAQITVNYSGGSSSNTRDVVESDGTTLVPVGNTVEIGWFTPGFDVTANGNNLSLLGANWHLFGATTTG